MGVITGGPNTPRIQKIVIQIDDCSIQANIQRQTLWVPKDQNVFSDYMSKLGSCNAYSFTVMPWVKELIERNFGTYTIDRLLHTTMFKSFLIDAIHCTLNPMQNG